MSADLGFNPQINQPAQQPVRQPEQPVREISTDAQENAVASNPQLQRMADVAELSRQAVQRQAESSEVSTEAQVELGRLSEVQNNLDAIAENVRSVRETANQAADEEMPEAELAQSQERVNENLEAVNRLGEDTSRQVRELQTAPAPITGRLEIVINTEDLGRLEVDPGETVSLSDAMPEGRASLNNDPRLAAQSAERALEEISLMQTEVANVASAASGLYLPGANAGDFSQQNAAEISQQIVGNALNNPGALLEAASGISTGNALDLLSS